VVTPEEGRDTLPPTYLSYSLFTVDPLVYDMLISVLGNIHFQALECRHKLLVCLVQMLHPERGLLTQQGAFLVWKLLLREGHEQLA
jgi:hypothetical protein